MRLREAPIFFGLALAIHLGALLVTAEDGQEAASSGAGGAVSVTVAAASPEIAAMVEAWNTPPDAAALADTLPEPEIVRAPSVPPPLQALEAAPTPSLAAPLPDPPDLPALALSAPPVPAPSPEPAEPLLPEPEVAANPAAREARPERRPEDHFVATPPRQPPAPASPVRSADPMQSRAAEAQAEQRAAGADSVEAQAGSGQAPAAVAAGERVRLLESWGALIQQRLQRALVYPRQAEMRRLGGTATVELTVGRDGRVLDRRLVASAGAAVLDEAALQTIERARGIPSAPEGLAGNSFMFRLPVTFQPG
jgi:periplasmic protein TonB